MLNNFNDCTFNNFYTNNNNFYIVVTQADDDQPAQQTSSGKRTRSEENNGFLSVKRKKYQVNNHNYDNSVSAPKFILKDLQKYADTVYPHSPLSEFFFNLKPDANSELLIFSPVYHFAAEKMDLELINLLTGFGIPATYLDDKNENALMVASRVHGKALKIGGFIEKRAGTIIEKLIEAKCDPLQNSINGIAPIHIMASNKAIEFFKLLNNLKFDLNYTDSFGESPLLKVCRVLNSKTTDDFKNSYLIIKTLVNLGCDLLQKNKFNEFPLEQLVKYNILNAEGYLGLLDYLPEDKENRKLVLETLLLTDNCEVFNKLFTDKMIPVDTFDSHGKTPLYRAVERLDKRAIDLLYVHMADPLKNRPILTIKFNESSNPLELLNFFITECKESIELYESELKPLREIERKTLAEETILAKKEKQLKSKEKRLLTCQQALYLLSKTEDTTETTETEEESEPDFID